MLHPLQIHVHQTKYCVLIVTWQKSSVPLIIVLLEPARSAEPPIKIGRFFAMAFKASPEEAR